MAEAVLAVEIAVEIAGEIGLPGREGLGLARPDEQHERASASEAGK